MLRLTICTCLLIASFAAIGNSRYTDVSPTGNNHEFIVLGDMHYDLVENHDMDWVNANGFHDQIVKSYSRNTARFIPRFVKTVKQMSERPGMLAIVQLGDMSEGLAGSDEKVRKMNRNLFRFIDSIDFKLPFIMTKGNHDITGPGAREAFKEIYVPGIRRIGKFDDNTTHGHYTKRVDDILFAVYDCFEKECSPAWLDSVLSNSDARHKFVLIHEPVIPINYQCRHLYRRPKDSSRRRDLLKAIASNKAIVLAGHIHQYAVLRRDTEWGPIVQINVNSVINNDDRDKLINVTTEYDPDMVDLFPHWHGDDIEQRREMLAAEAPHIRYYKWADMPGYAVITVRRSDNHVILDYYPNIKTYPCDTVDITEIYSAD